MKFVHNAIMLIDSNRTDSELFMENAYLSLTSLLTRSTATSEQKSKQVLETVTLKN